MTVQTIIILILSMTVIGFTVRVVKDNYYRVPFLSYPQGDSTIEGQIVSIEQIAPDVFQVGLKQELAVVDPEIDTKIIGFSGSCTSFAHFRGEVKKFDLKEGRIIRAETSNVLHRFTGRSLNWIKKWDHIDSARLGGVISIKKMTR